MEVVVEGQTFRLHRAIVWARCKWLQALLAERWQSKKESRIEVNSFSADVFGTVVEFLYTGCVRERRGGAWSDGVCKQSCEDRGGDWS